MRLTTRACVARAGIIIQSGDEMGEDPDSIFRVFFPPALLLHVAKTTKIVPITDDMHDSSNTDDFRAAVIGAATNFECRDGRLWADVTFWGTPAQVEAIKTGTRHQFSIAFQGDYAPAGESARYDFTATDMRLDHIALCENGRQGDACALPEAA
jgi:hypothetical protein